MKLLSEAIEFATKLHSKQFRWDWTPYILHPLRIMFKLLEEDSRADETILISAVLHDIVEDTTATISDIEEKFWTEVASIVSFLTQFKTESYETYIDRLLVNPKACKIKLLDLEDNFDLKSQSYSGSWNVKKVERLAKYLKAYNKIKNNGKDI